VQGILWRLEALGIVTVIDHRPRSNLYEVDVDADPWEYCYPADNQKPMRRKPLKICA